MKALNKFLCAAGAALAVAAAATAADATIYIGVSTDGGATVNGVADDIATPGLALYAGSQGNFYLNVVNGTNGTTPQLLTSNFNSSTNAAGLSTLDIYVTRTDLTGNQGFLSNFTSNSLPAGWTVTQTNYVSTADALWTGTQVGQAVFNAIGTSSAFNPGVDGTYSVTERYTISATGAGTQQSTINISAVPEPGVWALMLLGFGGMGAMLRSNRRRGLAFA